MSETRPLDPPSAFVVAWAESLFRIIPPARRALDVAMGRGRHAVVLAELGYRLFGVDNRFDAVRDAVAKVAGRGRRLLGWCADLTTTPLPRERFELIVVTRYLQRDLFPSLKDALVPGGVLVYETFTEAQRAHKRGPTSPDHLLQRGELRRYFEDFEILLSEEVDEPEAVARIVVRRRIRTG
jgi:SAM-dependent methyltransferase